VTDDEITKLKANLIDAMSDARYWRDRCRTYENQHSRLEVAAGEVKAATERFMIVLQHARPQGTEKRA
jgi:hypothetical protein